MKAPPAGPSRLRADSSFVDGAKVDRVDRVDRTGEANSIEPALRIRAFEEGDEQRLHAVFHSSIHTHAARDHSPEQLVAWSPMVVDATLAARWVERMRAIRPFVVETDGGAGGTIVGYADLQPDGYIDHFFVSGGFGGRGVGTRLMTHLIDQARLRRLALLTSDVSTTARGFFAGFGFEIVERQIVVQRGARFTSTRMRLDLDAAHG